MSLRTGDTQAGRGIALRVHVNQQDWQTADRKCGGEIDRRRRLTDAALLVRDSQDKWFGDDGPQDDKRIAAPDVATIG
jgi:hypothetical protein